MDLMNYRRQILASQSVSAPSGYRKIEYAESTGNAFVQLPFGFDRTDEIETEFALTETSNNMQDKYIVAASQWNTNRNRFGMGVHVAPGVGLYNVYTAAFGANSTGTTNMKPITVMDFSIKKWTYKNNVYSIPSLGLTLDVSDIAFGGTTANIKMFYGYASNTAGKIAYYKHTHDGVKHHIIPIQKISDGTVEMYDVATHTILPRTGTLLAPS